MTTTYLEPSERQKARAYSPAVITDGGRIVWMAGQTATTEQMAATSPAISRPRRVACLPSWMRCSSAPAGGWPTSSP